MLYDTQEPIIHVGILSESKINFELYGDFTSPGFKNTFSGRFTAEILNDKLLCTYGSEKIEITNEIIFAPTDISSDSFLLRDVTIGVQFHWERKEKERFIDAIKLLKENGKITVINSLSIENYLVSVISSEMSAKCSRELLKAHAIVSRGWLLAQIEKSRVLQTEKKEYKTTLQTKDALIRWYDREDHSSFDVCADDHCQRYQGITKVFTTVAKQAIEETRGLVLTYNDKICDARYSKSCGGVSESFENNWEPVKYNYLSSVIDYKYEPDNYDLDFSDEKNARKWILGNPPAFCNTTDKKILSQILLDYDQETTDFYRWTVTYSQEELSKLISNKSEIDFGQIVDLIPIERGASARLTKLKIVGTKKTLTIGKELEIRRTLSPSHLYSSAFIVEKENLQDGIPQKFTIKGAGWGHGVGLCQIGAAVMASQGYNFDEILLHYFTDAKLKKIY
jgi:SpoIID/LytB domain protein